MLRRCCAGPWVQSSPPPSPRASSAPAPRVGAAIGSTIYSGRTAGAHRARSSTEFADETGIGIDVRYGDSADLALLIDEEGDRSPADVFLSQSPGAVGYLDAKGRLAELPASMLDQVDERFRAPDGRWVGISGRVRVLVYNTDHVDPPTSRSRSSTSTEPRYRGQVGVAPTNASFQDFVTAMREIAGDDRTLEWLRGMEANGVADVREQHRHRRGRRARRDPVRAREPLLQRGGQGRGPGRRRARTTSSRTATSGASSW